MELKAYSLNPTTDKLLASQIESMEDKIQAGPLSKSTVNSVGSLRYHFYKHAIRPLLLVDICAEITLPTVINRRVHEITDNILLGVMNLPLVGTYPAILVNDSNSKYLDLPAIVYSDTLPKTTTNRLSVIEPYIKTCVRIDANGFIQLCVINERKEFKPVTGFASYQSEQPHVDFVNLINLIEM
jgi:hypothetical protein